MLSAAVSASVTSNTASTWLGPISASSDSSGMPSACAVRCTMRSGASAWSNHCSLSMLAPGCTMLTQPGTPGVLVLSGSSRGSSPPGVGSMR